MSEIPNTGGRGSSQPMGRGLGQGGIGQAPSGLSGPGRGVGVPNMMGMMPTIGRGMTPINPPMQRMPMPTQGMNIPQNLPNKMPMGGMMPSNMPMGGMIRPPMMNPMMVRPPQGGNLGKNIFNFLLGPNIMPNQPSMSNLNQQNQNQ